jgi:putative ABC transport system substrate-binding protein
MRRREFMSLSVGAAVGWPLAARAQQSAMPVIGFMSSGAEQAFAPNVAGFLKGLGEAGYTRGQNVALNIGGLTATTIDSAQWRKNWFASELPSS